MKRRARRVPKVTDTFLRVVNSMAYHISEMGCTCPDGWRTNNEGHHRDCIGEQTAQDHYRRAHKLVRQMGRLLNAVESAS